jgi:hypothetical protein
MAIEHEEIFAQLAAPFEPWEIRYLSLGGHQIAYVRPRTVMNRLDEVLGPWNWTDEYFETKEGLKCRLKIRIGDEWIAKEDGGAAAEMSDPDNSEKSAYSSALKRAAMKWGVGRYLYSEGVPTFVQSRYEIPAEFSPLKRDAAQQRPQGPQRGSWGPQDGTLARSGEPRPEARQGVSGSYGNNPPRTGRALFAWTKDQEQRYEVGLLKYLNGWSKLQEFPARMVDWDEEQVKLAYAEACRKLQEVGSQDSAPYEEAMTN